MLTVIAVWIAVGLILFLQNAMEMRLDRVWVRWTRRSRWCLLAAHVLAAPAILLLALVGVMRERGQRFMTPLELEDAQRKRRNRST